MCGAIGLDLSIFEIYLKSGNIHTLCSSIASFRDSGKNTWKKKREKEKFSFKILST